jgi:bacteriocin biosynthesis cyclodehydratase domain-containing protein
MPSIHHPRLAFPATVLTAPDTVWLVAGEDFRYKLSGHGVEHWLPEVLRQCQGKKALEELIAGLSKNLQAAARQVFDQLYGERVLVDGTAQDVHTPGVYRLTLTGTGPLLPLLSQHAGDESTPRLMVLCQDNLDYAAALEFNRRCLQEAAPFLWVTTGPMSRGYVSPVFLPGAGPCLACLQQHFQRLSPVPELYDALREHGQQGKPVEPVPFPEEGLAILAGIVTWKRKQLAEPMPPSALYQLHVLELETLEVTAHRVFVNPECPACALGS